MTPSPSVVYVVDDDSAVRKSLTRLLVSEGWNAMAFESAAAFIEQHDPLATGCVLLDLEMPGLNGIELQQSLSDRGSFLPVVFLTGRGDIHSTVQAMKLGAVDFLTKPADKSELLAALARAIERNRELRKNHDQRAAVEELLGRLTPREYEVLCCLASGRRNKQIAADLGTVEKTIKVHRARVLHKMQVRTLPELIQMVARAGVDLLSPGQSGATGALPGEHPPPARTAA